MERYTEAEIHAEIRRCAESTIDGAIYLQKLRLQLEDPVAAIRSTPGVATLFYVKHRACGKDVSERFTSKEAAQDWIDNFEDNLCQRCHNYADDGFKIAETFYMPEFRRCLPSQ